MSIRVIGKQTRVDPELVETLKTLLAEAEAGELSALVGVGERHDGDVWWLRLGEIHHPTTASRLLHLSVEFAAYEDDDEED